MFELELDVVLDARVAVAGTDTVDGCVFVGAVGAVLCAAVPGVVVVPVACVPVGVAGAWVVAVGAGVVAGAEAVGAAPVVAVLVGVPGGAWKTAAFAAAAANAISSIAATVLAHVARRVVMLTGPPRMAACTRE